MSRTVLAVRVLQVLKPDLLPSSLTPQEAAVENVGPVDDGTESLGDVPSLSEEVTGSDKSGYVATGLSYNTNKYQRFMFCF